MNLHSLFNHQDATKYQIITLGDKLNVLDLSSRTFYEVTHKNLSIGMFLQRKGEKPLTIYLLSRVGDPSKVQKLTAVPVYGDYMRSTAIVDVVDPTCLTRDEATKIFGSDLAGWEIIEARVTKV